KIENRNLITFVALSPRNCANITIIVDSHIIIHEANSSLASQQVAEKIRNIIQSCNNTQSSNPAIPFNLTEQHHLSYFELCMTVFALFGKLQLGYQFVNRLTCTNM